MLTIFTLIALATVGVIIILGVAGVIGLRWFRTREEEVEPVIKRRVIGITNRGVRKFGGTEEDLESARTLARTMLTEDTTIARVTISGEETFSIEETVEREGA